MSYKIEILSKNLNRTGEGPHWDDAKQRLLFVDFDASAIYTWDYATSAPKKLIILEDPAVAAVVPREKGGLVAAAGLRFVSIDEETGKVETIVQATENTKCYFNDGKCDPRGRFWAGTMGLEGNPGEPIPTQGELFTLDTDLTVKKKLSKLEISNGLSWTEDCSKMFFIDSLRQDVTVYKYDVDTGDISEGQKVVEFDREIDGMPDGHCIDADGNLWVAMFFGGRIIKVDPRTGQKVERIEISKSAVKTTSCCFGGPNFDELYVTSATNIQFDFDRGYETGDSGSLFRVTGVGARGLPCMPFKG